MENSILATEAGTELPTPVAISTGKEVIWSANTGRTASGRMVGTVLAEKETVTITWGVLTKAEFNSIEQKMPSGFIKIKVFGDTLEVYRGTLNAEALGYIGDGIFYYRSASTDLVER